MFDRAFLPNSPEKSLKFFAIKFNALFKSDFSGFLNPRFCRTKPVGNCLLSFCIMIIE